ncbi:DUF885 domain-containing protein [Nakamurella aerolata]|uniref:DUF885 domain-containing protein n=1 Tax=Nakamurella aerolata TaxID=1656892 RepID=A0A849AC54_9ACTN|nr:DUF885 domain-containing protein [Nakamurella aerolata]NNG36070.1 DUF885 domain-containing protein [Nakamurella aerolata]
MTSRSITEISNSLIPKIAEHSPIYATYLGVPGHDDKLDDLSPAGRKAEADMVAEVIAEASAVEPADDAERLAKDVLLERLQVTKDQYDSGWTLADLNVIASPVQNIRQIFDLMPHETDEQRGTLARRMQAVPGALAGYRQSLASAAADGKVVARRQVQACITQCEVFAGGTEPGFFAELAGKAGAGDGSAVGQELTAGATAASSAYADLARFLTDELLPKAPEKDAVGRERYALESRSFLGATVDLEESYRWGWQEFLAIEAELREVAARIAPGESDPHAAADKLDDDPAYQVRGKDGLQQWMQQLSDSAVEELSKTHFDVQGPMRTLACSIAPPGGGVGAYYTGPTDDFSRPGTMWWSVEEGREVFSTWRETTTVYHEGVPGHHLQIATAVAAKDQLNDFQRLIAGTSGHAEGWALYAERLVRELGYLDDDGDLLGMLDAQLFRAARVVVDIGMHLELEIPEGTGFHEGERWTPELGLEFLLTRTISDPAHARDEIDRYLGWPGQAPAYKLGERVWLTGRDNARRRHGEAFDPKAFHTAALRAGGMGLDPLAALLDTL